MRKSSAHRSRTFSSRLPCSEHPDATCLIPSQNTVSTSSNSDRKLVASNARRPPLLWLIESATAPSGSISSSVRSRITASPRLTGMARSAWFEVHFRRSSPSGGPCATASTAGSGVWTGRPSVVNRPGRFSVDSAPSIRSSSAWMVSSWPSASV